MLIGLILGWTNRKPADKERDRGNLQSLSPSIMKYSIEEWIWSWEFWFTHWCCMALLFLVHWLEGEESWIQIEETSCGACKIGIGRILVGFQNWRKIWRTRFSRYSGIKGRQVCRTIVKVKEQLMYHCWCCRLLSAGYGFAASGH